MKHKFAIAIFAILLFIPWLGLKQLHSRGEAREALVAQSMSLSGNYILPQSYSDLVPSKPPLLHWMINAASNIVGDLNEFSVRLPVAIASIIFAFYLVSYLQELGFKNYLIPSILLLTSIQWFRHSNTARVDMLLSVGSVVAILELYKWRAQKNFKDIPWLCLFGLIIAVYSKGPVGLVLPLAIFSIWSFLEKDSLKTIIIRCVQISIPVCLVGIVWYLFAYNQAGQSFIDKFWYENAQRLAGTMADEPHKGTVIYLYLSIFWSMLPWSLIWFLPLFLWFKSPGKIQSMKNNFNSSWNKSSFDKFVFVWIISFVLFYSIPESKRDVYLLPIMPALSIVLCRQIFNLSINKLEMINSITKLIVVISVVITAMLGLLVSLELGFFDFIPKIYQYTLLSVGEYINDNRLLLIIVLIVSLLINKLFVNLDGSYESKLVSSFIVKFGIILIIVQAVFAPAVGNAISYKNFADETSDIVQVEQKLFSYNDAFYGLSFYLKKKFYEIHPEGSPNIVNGKYYLFENNLSTFQEDLISGQCTRTLARSSKPMVDPKRFVLLLEVYNCGS